MSNTFLSFITASALSLFSAAPGRCPEEAQRPCTLPNGCGGFRFCQNGVWGACQCDGGGGVSSTACTTECGTTGRRECSASCVVSDYCQDAASPPGKCIGTAGFVARSCTPGTQIPVRGLRFTSDWISQDRSGSGTQYSNNINYLKKIYFSNFAESATLYFSTFVLGAGDAMLIQGNAHTGFLPAAYRAYNLNNAATEKMLDLNFATDAIAPARGFWIGDDGSNAGVQVTCGNFPWGHEENVLPDYEDTQGVLLGDGDVIKFRVNTKDNREAHIMLLAPPFANTDFDLYVKEQGTGTITRSDFDFRNIQPGSDAMITLPAGPAKSFDLIVVSYSGAGVFGIRLKHAYNKPSLKVGARSTTENDLPTWQAIDILRRGSRLFFGATEGQIYPADIKYYGVDGCWCGGLGCDICMDGGCDRSWVVTPPGWMVLCVGGPGPRDGVDRTLMHEYGHLLGWVGDEYRDHPNCTPTHSDNLCDHTMMSNHHPFWANNFCVAQEHRRDFTFSPGHACEQKQPSTDCNSLCAVSPNDIGATSGWSHMKFWGKVADEMSRTPDLEPFQWYLPLDQIISVHQ